MISNLTTEEVELAKAQYDAASRIVASLSEKKDLSEDEKRAYSAALTYLFVCFENSPVLVDDREAARSKEESAA